ncbi:MAG: helix-turn-helix domain-containing protein [Ferruginibacter sp.]
MEQNTAQVLFFQQIKSLLPPHISVADEIARVLDISTDSAYRRIRGEKPLSFEDLQKLAVTYKVSLDQFLHLQSNGFIFAGNLGYTSGDFVVEYLDNMLQQFEFMRGFDHKHIYFLPNDIPPFAYFQVPELAAFTFFYYKKSLLHMEDLKDMKFSVKDLNEEHVKLGIKVQASFNHIPSTEIWSIDTINSILRHISFYRDTHVFETREDIICLYDKLDGLITHLEKQAEHGLKFNHGQSPGKDAAVYRMYHNDLITGDNCVLAEIGDKKVTYINHNLINFMYTRDEDFNKYTCNTFENAIRKSTQISLVGEKARARFFDGLRRKIQAQREAINHY